MLKLTPKQRVFVDEYLIDLNATAAARRAGYSKKTAQVIGAENLSKPLIAAVIAKAQAERAERLKIDADWVLKRLVAEAEADLADLFTDDGALKPAKEWPKIWRQGLVAGLDTQELFADHVKIGNKVKLRLSDRIRRIELIGKHIGVQAFAERREVSGPDGGPIKVEDELSAMEVARRIAWVLAKAAQE